METVQRAQHNGRLLQPEEGSGESLAQHTASAATRLAGLSADVRDHKITAVRLR